MFSTYFRESLEELQISVCHGLREEEKEEKEEGGSEERMGRMNHKPIPPTLRFPAKYA